MIQQIERQECRQRFPSFPQLTYNPDTDTDDFFYPESVQWFVLELSSKTFRGHVSSVAKHLSVILATLGIDQLIFLGEADVPWLSQDNKFNPVQQALQYLRDNGVTGNFSGGLVIDHTEWVVFIRHLGWLSRCNASLPYIYFMDERQRLLVSLCKYGNLHIDILDVSIQQDFINAVGSTPFRFTDRSECGKQSWTRGAIQGRQIQL